MMLQWEAQIIISVGGIDFKGLVEFSSSSIKAAGLSGVDPRMPAVNPTAAASEKGLVTEKMVGNTASPLRSASTISVGSRTRWIMTP